MRPGPEGPSGAGYDRAQWRAYHELTKLDHPSRIVLNPRVRQTMFLARFRIIALAIIATAVTAFGYQGSAGPWPSPVQKGPDGSPALSPAEALKTFSMPPGYHLELV